MMAAEREELEIESRQAPAAVNWTTLEVTMDCMTRTT